MYYYCNTKLKNILCIEDSRFFHIRLYFAEILQDMLKNTLLYGDDTCNGKNWKIQANLITLNGIV